MSARSPAPTFVRTLFSVAPRAPTASSASTASTALRPPPRLPTRRRAHPGHRLRAAPFSTTKRAAPIMALPTEETLRASRFPTTVDHAASILATVSPSAPVPAQQLGLLSVLLSSAHGARGLFVALLSDPSIALADADPLDTGLIRAMVDARAPGDDVAALNEEGNAQPRYVRELAVKNTVMSAAMVVAYGADERDALRADSASTCARAKRVLAAWDAAEHAPDRARAADGDDGVRVFDVAKQMYESVTSGGEVFDPFVKKWDYTPPQRRAMAAALLDVFPALGAER